MSIIPVQRRRPKPDFSLTIINIVFLLLLFYLATGSLVKQSELEADVPVTADLPLERLPRPILLVTAGSELLLDGRPVSRPELAEAARAAVQAQNVTFLNVLADRTMPASAFLDVLAGAGASGVPLRIVTLRRPLAPAAGD